LLALGVLLTLWLLASLAIAYRLTILETYSDLYQRSVLEFLRETRKQID